MVLKNRKTFSVFNIILRGRAEVAHQALTVLKDRKIFELKLFYFLWFVLSIITIYNKMLIVYGLY